MNQSSASVKGIGWRFRAREKKIWYLYAVKMEKKLGGSSKPSH